MILLGLLYINFLLDFECWRQKLSKFNNFQFLMILFLVKITIFGAKIQIIQVIFSFKNSQKLWLFSLKIQIQNFEFFFLKIECSDLICDFLTVWIFRIAFKISRFLLGLVDLFVSLRRQ